MVDPLAPTLPGPEHLAWSIVCVPARVDDDAATGMRSPSDARSLRKPDGALTPRGGGQQAGLRPRGPRELYREGQTIGSETRGQRDRRHARGAPRRAEVRIARGVESLG